MKSALRHRPSVRGYVGLTLRLGALGVFAVFFVGPLVWLALAPTKTDYELTTRSPLAVGNLHNIWIAWQSLYGFDNHIFVRWMENSLIYCSSGTAIALVTVIPAGYGLATGSFRGRGLILTLTLVAMLIPSAALVLPIFLELNAARLIGTIFAVILPFSFFPFGVYLTYLYYATVLPPDLRDAARIDGCGDWAVFRRIGIPLAKPVIALVFFFSFVANWHNFFLPYVIQSNDRQFPVEVGLSDIFQSTRPALALATIIAAAPVLIVFAFSQRTLARGLLGGATKG